MHTSSVLPNCCDIFLLSWQICPFSCNNSNETFWWRPERVLGESWCIVAIKIVPHCISPSLHKYFTFFILSVLDFPSILAILLIAERGQVSFHQNCSIPLFCRCVTTLITLMSAKFMFLHLWMLKVKTWDTQHILFSVSSCSGLLSFRKIQLNEFILSQVPRPDYIGHTVVWYTKMWNINYKTKMWRRWLWYMKEAHLAEFSHQLSPHPTTAPHNFHEQLNVHCTTVKHPTTAPHIMVNFHLQLNVHCTTR